MLAHFRKRIVPFIDNLSDRHSDYTHLEYLGCGHVRAGNYGQLEGNLKKTYRAFFSKGFSEEELKEKVGEEANLQDLIIRCFHDSEKLQIGVLDEDVLDTISDRNKIDSETKQKLKQLFESSTKTENEVKDMLVDAIPEMERIFEVWGRSPFNQFELTSVGIAIAHANYRRKVGDTMDLSIWIK